VLLLHLKRFQHDGRGRLNKLDTAVKFEFELDLSSFMAGDAPGSSSSTAAAAAGADSGGSSGLQQQYQQLAPQESLMYDLVGLVVHMGTMRGGHYVAYVKRVLGSPGQDPAGEGSSNGGGNSSAGRVQWYYVSDTSVRTVNVTEVASAQAYMLLYVRRPGKQQQQQQEAAEATAEQEQQEEHA
jgi:ubiquitin carboxyl-terminal hydrolase 16/45